jgi:serine/threonine-protein kinase
MAAPELATRTNDPRAFAQILRAALNDGEIAVQLDRAPASREAHLLHVVLAGPQEKAVWLNAQPVGASGGLTRLRVQPRSKVQAAQLYALAELVAPGSGTMEEMSPPSVRVYSQAPPPLEGRAGGDTLPTLTRSDLTNTGMSVTTVYQDPWVGRLLGGKYRLEALLGSGAIGVVYRALHAELERPVAVKILHAETRVDANLVARFRVEARAAARLDHPNVTRVLDFGEEQDGTMYLVMEFVPGVTVESVVARAGHLAQRRGVDIAYQVCGALACAHHEGIVHRDIKPENVMLLQGYDADMTLTEIVKVCDFGVAKNMDAASRGLTVGQVLVGSPMYMSPEQTRSEKLDGRSDLYSLGVMLFEMTTGRVPFLGADIGEVIAKHALEMPPMPSQLVPDYDKRLEAIVLQCLAKVPSGRPGSARDLRFELEKLRDSMR